MFCIGNGLFEKIGRDARGGGRNCGLDLAFAVDHTYLCAKTERVCWCWCHALPRFQSVIEWNWKCARRYYSELEMIQLHLSISSRYGDRRGLQPRGRCSPRCQRQSRLRIWAGIVRSSTDLFHDFSAMKVSARNHREPCPY